MRKALLAAAALLAAVPATAASADAVTIKVGFAAFQGVLSYPDGEGYYTATGDFCNEVHTEPISPAKCTVRWKLTKGLLRCSQFGDPESVGVLDYTSHTAGATVRGVPLFGVTVNDTGVMRGHIIDVTGTTVHALSVELKLAGPCTGDRPSAFKGTVNYF